MQFGNRFYNLIIMNITNHSEPETNKDLSARVFHKQGHQHLLNKINQSQRLSFEFESRTQKTQKKPSPKNRQLIVDWRPEHNQTEQECFACFRAFIGRCCTPCAICCSCCCCPACCICQAYPLYRQQTQSLGILESWGRFTDILEPGLHVINPVCQSITQINQQTRILEFQQKGLTKDNVQFSLTTVVFYRVCDSIKVAYRLGSYDIQECISQIGSGMVRNVVGQNVLQKVIENRELITCKVRDDMNVMLQYWGLYVQMCSIKDLAIDQQIKTALEMVAVTKRTSEALLVDFKAEVQCGMLIKQIAQIIDSPAAYQIRYLNAVQQILQNNADTTLFLKTTMKNPQEHQLIDKNTAKGLFDSYKNRLS